VPPAVDRLTLGPLATNCYVARSGGASAEAVVIDPSGTAEEIRTALAVVGARCVAILVTHGHFDHVTALADLAEQTRAPVHAPAAERALLEHPERFTPPGINVRPCVPEVLLEGGERLVVAGIELDVLSVPGHSPGHVAYWRESDRVLIVGDVMNGMNLITTIPGLHEPPKPFTPDPARNRESIRKVAALRPELVCFGHGPPFRDPDKLARFADQLPA